MNCRAFLIGSITVLSLMLTGCMSCVRRAARLSPIQDHLQSYVIVGFGHPPCCPLPWKDKPYLTDRHGSINFWVRAVNKDKILVAEKQKQLSYTIVNDFGELPPATSQFSGIVITDSDGYAAIPQYHPLDLGVYHLKVDYSDRTSLNSSYSPAIIVR